MSNIEKLQDLVQGDFGRKTLWTDVDVITPNNVIKVLGDNLNGFYRNRSICEYLWKYKNGDQPAWYRIKTVRDDVNNPVVENHAWEIVQFKNAQTNGEPMQCVSLRKDEKINAAVDKFNDYCRGANKHVKDISCGEWISATGIGYKACIRKRGSEVPFGITVPTPLNTAVIYSRQTEEPILAFQQLKDADNKIYYAAYSDTLEFRIQNSQLVPFDVLGDGTKVNYRIHAFGGIPIVEYRNNQSAISDIELVISMLDAINEIQSNRVDSVEQFVQSWIKFVNCDIDEETFGKMKMKGTLVVKSNNGSENKADVDIMTQELNQSQTQIAKDDLWESAMSISAIPNREGNTGGDTQGAVSLRNGWDFAKQRAKIKDPYIVESEKRLNTVLLNIIRQEKGVNECPIGMMDYEVQISHSPTDNMLTKTQTLQLLMQAGIHPLIAIKTSGLWADGEKVFLNSKQYLDVLYKTVEDELGVEEVKRQEDQAKQIIEENANGNTENGRTEQSAK